MSEIRVERAPEFKGETVILLAMDSDGLDAFRSALARAGQQPSQLTHAGTIHEFAIEDGNAEVELQAGHVTWRFARSKLTEVIEKLDAMKEAAGPCHHYVDISSPAETLVLSRDEYV
jgi:hypothetical protein